MGLEPREVVRKLNAALGISGLIWIGGSTLTQLSLLSGNMNGSTYTEMDNLHHLFTDGFGSLTIILGLTLFVRWAWRKFTSARTQLSYIGTWERAEEGKITI